MRFTLGSLLLMLLVCSLPAVHGVLEAYNTNLKCKCIQEISGIIPIQLIERLQIFPPGNGCPKREIIVWKKNKSVVFRHNMGFQIPICTEGFPFNGQSGGNFIFMRNS
uniref:Chemokine interleukin-8-like domain-containing protein n=1 Tax=Canis lupus dingo TaxID=286419 RepID=A0A8C0KDA0_CANLU